MGLTVTLDHPKPQRISKDLQMVTGSIAFDSSYPTGGEAATDISKYFSTLQRIVFESSAGYMLTYDKTNDKVLAYRFDYDAVADGAAIEVANTTDLSGITAAGFVAIGYAGP